MKTTPINPTMSAMLVEKDTFSFNMGMDIKPINKGDVAFNNVDSDKPICPMA